MHWRTQRWGRSRPSLMLIFLANCILHQRWHGRSLNFDKYWQVPVRTGFRMMWHATWKAREQTLSYHLQLCIWSSTSKERRNQPARPAEFELWATIVMSRFWLILPQTLCWSIPNFKDNALILPGGWIGPSEKGSRLVLTTRLQCAAQLWIDHWAYGAINQRNTRPSSDVKKYQKGSSEAQNGYGFGMIPGYGLRDGQFPSLM